MTDEQIGLIRHRLQRAHESLQEAQLLLTEGYANTALSRLYYACFYAVTALLLTDGTSSSRHAGVRALFDQKWVKTGKVSVESGRLYRDLFNGRQQSDYADFVRFDTVKVNSQLQSAHEFVASIESLIYKLLTGPLK